MTIQEKLDNIKAHGKTRDIVAVLLCLYRGQSELTLDQVADIIRSNGFRLTSDDMHFAVRCNKQRGIA